MSNPIVNRLETIAADAVKALYDIEIQIPINPTRPGFKGEYTAVIFPLVKSLKKSPQEIGAQMGDFLVQNNPDFITDYEQVQGFVNLVIHDTSFSSFLRTVVEQVDTVWTADQSNTVMVEYSSPNTNKPLHLGHLRNIVLGASTSNILSALGNKVLRTQIVNDRGIAICKSMIAWQKFGEGKTPEQAGLKSDHFVGDFYVRYDQELNAEYDEWQSTDAASRVKENSEDSDAPDFWKKYKRTYVREYSPLSAETRDMLQKWENQDPLVLDLWSTMNNYVYKGFKETYDKLGVDFDVSYYESQTYLLGKDIVQQGINSGVFYKKEDGSVWADLTDEGLDHKIVLRADGTSVYITQDLGTADVRYREHQMDSVVYVVGNEQDYHFQVLFKILKKLGVPYADKLYHLSYGMVDLPTGKMKSREGNVVDTDDLIREVKQEARKSIGERGSLDGLTQDEVEEIIDRIAMGALKYFIIKVNPKKRMTFDPKESVDLQGQTGPYIQNAFVRIQSIMRKVGLENYPRDTSDVALNDQDKEIIKQLMDYNSLLHQAAEHYDPSLIANAMYQLAKDYHKYYHDHQILRAESDALRTWRLDLSTAVAQVLQHGMNLLGIQMPQKM